MLVDCETSQAARLCPPTSSPQVAGEDEVLVAAVDARGHGCGQVGEEAAARKARRQAAASGGKLPAVSQQARSRAPPASALNSDQYHSFQALLALQASGPSASSRASAVRRPPLCMPPLLWGLLGDSRLARAAAGSQELGAVREVLPQSSGALAERGKRESSVRSKMRCSVRLGTTAQAQASPARRIKCAHSAGPAAGGTASIATAAAASGHSEVRPSLPTHAQKSLRRLGTGHGPGRGSVCAEAAATGCARSRSPTALS